MGRFQAIAISKTYKTTPASIPAPAKLALQLKLVSEDTDKPADITLCFFMSDAKRSAPATQRNREPILQVLQRVLPTEGTVLEVGSGTGEHAIFFAPRLQPRQWQPSDVDSESLASISAWMQEYPCENLHPPLELDIRDASWCVERGKGYALQVAPITAIASINTIHIAPWSATEGLMAGAGRILPSGGILYLYGPFQRNGRHTAPSNESFDASLRFQNPEWGIRHLEDVINVAQANQLEFLETVDMPANNFSVVFQRKNL